MTVALQNNCSATPREPTDAEIDKLLRLGLPNRWYPIVPSGMVTGGRRPAGSEP